MEVHPEKPTSVAVQRNIVVDQLFERSGAARVLLTCPYMFASLCTWWPSIINNWRELNCCVANSLPGEVVVESVPNWDYLIGSNISTIGHGYRTSRS